MARGSPLQTVFEVEINTFEIFSDSEAGIFLSLIKISKILARGSPLQTIFQVEINTFEISSDSEVGIFLSLLNFENFGQRFPSTNCFSVCDTYNSTDSQNGPFLRLKALVRVNC